MSNTFDLLLCSIYQAVFTQWNHAAKFRKSRNCIHWPWKWFMFKYRVSHMYLDDFWKLGVASKLVKPRLQNFLSFVSIIMAKFYENFVTIASILIWWLDLFKYFPSVVCSILFFRYGGTQQLRGPNFTQFWPPPPLEWTNMDISKTIYPLSHDPLGLSTGPLHVVIEWPLKLVVESS